MKNMSRIQCENHIFDRCRAWWTTYNSCDEEVILNSLSQIRALIEYFRMINNRYVEHRDKVLWIQLEVILTDCEVAIDNEALYCLGVHARVVEELLGQIAKYVI
jgi:hypothetical protein